MLTHKDTVLGLGDGGAHLGLVCDASYPTTMLAHWTRDRTRGPRILVQDAVKALTSEVADTVGLRDRGRIEIGRKADMNVINYDRVLLRAPRVVHDLPTGARRIIQPADGYVATVVTGAVTHRDGEPTGAMPGRVVRGARAEHSPLLNRRGRGWRQIEIARCRNVLPAVSEPGDEADTGIHLSQRLGEDRRDDPVPVPLPVRGDHIPRCPLGRGLREHLFERTGVVVPELPFVKVLGPDLPLLVGIGDARIEPFKLLVVRDMEEELHYGRARISE